VLLGGALIFASVLIAYWPALHGGFLWDDDSWTTNILGLLRDASGLRSMWFKPAALPQYYPLSATTFWLDYHLWGLNTLPYHVENVLLHATGALLFWRLLRRLEVPGAWLASAIFALHPLMVESAAWITERKNVLSIVLYLSAVLAYGRFARFWRASDAQGPEMPQLRRRGAYAIAFLLFAGALLAKTTAFSLPAVLLLICWWKRGRIRWREDVSPTLPFFATSIGLGQVTAWLEKNSVGATGPDWAISFPQRFFIAGRALWFYAGKLLWPADLCFVYPRWQLDAGSVALWAFPITAAGAILTLWLLRGRIGRGPATAALFFAGTLFPVLGFMNVYYMRYSFVCDHWTYLSSLGLIALGAALIVGIAQRAGHPAAAYGFAAVLLPLLGVMTWHQARAYRDLETLWRDTIEKNPGAWLAHNNLGLLLAAQGRNTEAELEYNEVLRLKPDSWTAHNDLGTLFSAEGRKAEAEAELNKALRLKPGDPDVHYNLANLFATTGRIREAIPHYEQAIELKPDDGDMHNNLGVAFYSIHQADAAVLQFRQAIRCKPESANFHCNLGNAFLAQHRLNEATREYMRALELNPDYAEPRVRLRSLEGNLRHGDERLPPGNTAVQPKP
jgi:Flp pilus assembly protein TadD